MKKSIRSISLLVVISMMFLLVGCRQSHGGSISTEARLVEDIESELTTEFDEISLSNVDENLPLEEVEVQSKNPIEPPEDKSAVIVSFGDTLAHKTVFNGAYNEETGEYDFSSMFQNVSHYFEDADVVIGNNESSYAGAERGYSGYPCFNCPEHLAIDLAEMGVDIMTTANNHCLDMGYSGLCTTLDYLDDAGIRHVGTSRSQEEQNEILFMDLNGIKTAFLSFTYGTNGIPVPNDAPYCVNLIDEDLMLKQIERSKLEGAELIVASMHWGIEYQTVENEEQDRLANLLIDNGVNIILGCHPHVLQPIKKINGGLVIFSQGNFFSAQNKPNTQDTAIFRILVTKNGTSGEVTVDSVTYYPVYVYNNGYGADPRYELLDLQEIIRSFEAGENVWSEDMYTLALAENERCISILESEE